MSYSDPDIFGNIRLSAEIHIHLNAYINRQTTRFLGFERPDVVVRNHCIVRGLRFGAPYPDTEYWVLISSRMMQEPGTLERNYYCPICAGFETFLPREKPATATTVYEARWSYSPYNKGVPCLSATTLWWSLNFPWNGIPVPFTLHGSQGSRSLHNMKHVERIHFPIRWPTWRCSRITGEYTVIFCVLATTCFHQHVQQSNGSL